MSIGYIYKLTSPSNKVYIGQTWHFNQRINQYRCDLAGGQPKLNNAIKKYGFDSFEIEILDYLHTQEDLDLAEIYWIDYFKGIKNGYNIREGGSHGSFTQKTKNLMSKNNWLKNGGCTNEYRKKMSIACSGGKNGFYGKHHSEKTKNFLKNKFKGKKLPQSQIENIRKGHIGLKRTQNHKNNLSLANSVYIYEITFPNGKKEKAKSLTKFCKDNNLCYTSLWRVSNGIYENFKGFKVKIIETL